MPVKIIYKNKRQSIDRRKGSQAYSGTEKRTGVDRRTLDEKLKHLIESNMKAPEKEKQTLIHQGSGTVIRRKKSEKDNSPA